MMNRMFMDGLQEATRLTREGRLHEATELLQRSLGGAPIQAEEAGHASSAANDSGATIEGSYRVVDDVPASAESEAGTQGRGSAESEASQDRTSAGTKHYSRERAQASTAQHPFAAGMPSGLQEMWREKMGHFRGPESWQQPFPEPMPDSEPCAGKFVSGNFSCQAGTRDYKLYIPSGYHGQALPLVVMLHGCTQHPDDFAAGTGMNKLAEEQLCLVLYPAQPVSANTSKCWNWFKATDQQRERGEPAILAGMTRQIVDEYRLDEKRVYVAGLSAGGAMATTLAMTYPDLYAAVGIHSGLPHAAAHDLPSALAAMQGGTGPLAGHSNGAAFGSRSQRDSAGSVNVPAVVFHGDRDTTVHPCNGDRVAAQYLASSDSSEASRKQRTKVERGQASNGHAYTCTTHHDAQGQPKVEQWVIHGAGHAWSGGDRRGSYTDPNGPDASREMLRFFLAHPKTAVSTG